MLPTLRPVSALLLTLLVGGPLLAQAPVRGVPRTASRAQLESLAQTLERAVASPAYGDRTRARAEQDLAEVRRRLLEGDFRPGDQILVRIEGPAPLPDTALQVSDSLVLDIPNVRRVRLYGVLRTEVQERLTAEVREVQRNAMVTARPLMRLAVLGAVTSPGYRVVPPDALIDQVLATAGSMLPAARADRMQLLRADTVVADAPTLVAAIANGRSLESVGARDGDALHVPQGNPPRDGLTIAQLVAAFVFPIVTLLAVR